MRAGTFFSPEITLFVVCGLSTTETPIPDSFCSLVLSYSTGIQGFLMGCFEVQNSNTESIRSVNTSAESRMPSLRFMHIGMRGHGGDCFQSHLLGSHIRPVRSVFQIAPFWHESCPNCMNLLISALEEWWLVASAVLGFNAHLFRARDSCGLISVYFKFVRSSHLFPSLILPSFLSLSRLMILILSLILRAFFLFFGHSFTMSPELQQLSTMNWTKFHNHSLQNDLHIEEFLCHYDLQHPCTNRHPPYFLCKRRTIHRCICSSRDATCIFAEHRK